MKKIGLFGGTFDPIHFGHLNLAVALSEAHHLDEVLFCPVSHSPFKETQPSVAPEHRMAMVLLTIQEIPLFGLCKLELERGGISYTVDTLRELRERYRQKNEPVQLYLLLSQEAGESFHRWKEAEELIQLATVLLGSRQGASSLPPSSVRQALSQGFTPTPLMEISSTEVRERLSKGLYCGHLVPAIVLDYIKCHHLY